jgi:hypothetical protein
VTVNVALANPAGTVMLAGTFAGSPADKDTTAPPSGATAFRIAVPVTNSPPTTVGALSEMDRSTTAACAVTVSIGDRPVLPLSDAAIVAVPAETPVTANVALDEPAGTNTGVGTIATAGLLVDNAMLEPPAGAAAVRLTVA